MARYYYQALDKIIVLLVVDQIIVIGNGEKLRFVNVSVSNSTIMSNFQPLKALGRGSETQLQCKVCKNMF